MSVAAWERVLDAIGSYHHLLAERFGGEVESRIIWHGGEPLLLPLPYLKEVVQLQHRALAGLRHRVLMQTNLFHLDERVIDLIEEEDIGVGVSLDVVGGVRLTSGGRETRHKVVDNLDRLDRRGIRYGAITVLARHTLHRLREVHDFWAARGVSFRVLPLFEGPGERPQGVFEVSDEELAAALGDLAEYWIERGALVDVAPLSEWLADVVRKLAGQRVRPYDRRLAGERVLLVETTGDLFQTDERGRYELRLGNLITESMEAILQGPRYERSLLRTEAKAARVCGGCDHFGFCDGYPAHAEPFESTADGRCPVTAQVHDRMERYLRTAGYDAATLLAPLAEAPV